MSGPLGGNGKWGCPRHRGQDLRVLQRDHPHSLVRCFVEGCTWATRTKAHYVRTLPDAYVG